MSGLSISKAWEDSKDILARDGKLFVSVALALITLPQAILGLVGLPTGKDAPMGSKIAYLLVLLVGFAAQIALNRLAVPPSVTVGVAIRRGFARLLPFIGSFLLFVVAMAIVLVVVAFALGSSGVLTSAGSAQTPSPALILTVLGLVIIGSAIFQLTLPVAANESGGPIRLLVRSWQLGKGHYLRLLGFVALVIVGVIVVAIVGEWVIGTLVISLLGAPGPGSLAALIMGLMLGLIQAAFTLIAALMLARIYVQLADRPDADASVPKTGI